MRYNSTARIHPHIHLMGGLSLGLVLALPLPVRAQWTQWGGEHQDFKAQAHSLASSWPESGPKQLWKRDLGDGYSAILVNGNRLYTMYRSDDMEKVIALDAKTGNTVWEYKYDSNPSDIHEHNFGDGPRSTPLLTEGRLYAIGVSSEMHCLDAKSGKVLWRHNLWKEFGGNTLNHGYASSPIRYGDNIITLVGGENAAIVAFEKETGKVAWKNLSFKNSYSTPKIVKIHGKDQLITYMAQEVIGTDPNDGHLLWRYEIGNQWGQNVSMPIWFDDADLLFLSTVNVGSRGLKLVPSGDHFDVEELWTTRKLQLYHVNSVRVGDFVFGSTGGAVGGPALMAAINAKTGKVAWRKRGFAKATCVWADGRLIILDGNGELAIATATPESLTVHSRAKMLEPVSWTVPTIVGSNLYVRNKKIIMALDLS